MDFFLDENMAVVSLEPLRLIFRHQHTFETAGTLGLMGVDDIDLYPRVKAAGIQAIISKDERQLRNDTERRGLFDNRLTFIHLHMGKIGGAKGLALELAALTAGLPYVVERWTPEPTAFRLRGLQSGFTERVSSTQDLWLARWGKRPGK
jgi:hypothetical protein